MKKITLIFFTICQSIFLNAQLSEGFETGVPPSGWVSFIGANGAGTTNNWESSAISNSGSFAALVKNETSSMTNEDWLVTSLVDLSGVTNAEMRFFARQNFSTVFNSIYSVRVSTTDQTTISNFVTIKSWDESQLTSASDVYQEKIVDLSAYDGSSIYIAFVMENNNGDDWWIDDIMVAASSGCDTPVTPIVTNIQNTSADFYWEPVVNASLGYDWVVMAAGDNPDVDTPITSGTTATGVTQATTNSLAFDTPYDFYVKAKCGVATESGWSTVFSFTTLEIAPDNDALCNATSLTVGNSSSGGTYSNIGATNQVSEPKGSCWFNSDLATNTVWFSFVAPPSGGVWITTNIMDGTLQDTQLALYSVGACGNMATLTQLGCGEDISDENFLTEMEVTGLTPGSTYYLQVDGFEGEVGTFDIGISEATLNTNDLDSEIKLAYYPNPVSGSLYVNASNAISSISIYSLLGQLVSETTFNNSKQVQIDMSTLKPGHYIVTVNSQASTRTIKIIKD